MVKRKTNGSGYQNAWHSVLILAFLLLTSKTSALPNNELGKSKNDPFAEHIKTRNELARLDQQGVLKRVPGENDGQLAEGIFFADATDHERMKQVTDKFFSKDSVKGMQKTMESESLVLVNRWKTKFVPGNFEKDVKTTLGNIYFRIMFNSQYDFFKDPENQNPTSGFTSTSTNEELLWWYGKIENEYQKFTEKSNSNWFRSWGNFLHSTIFGKDFQTLGEIFSKSEYDGNEGIKPEERLPTLKQMGRAIKNMPVFFFTALLNRIANPENEEKQKQTAEYLKSVQGTDDYIAFFNQMSIDLFHYTHVLIGQPRQVAQDFQVEVDGKTKDFTLGDTLKINQVQIPGKVFSKVHPFKSNFGVGPRRCPAGPYLVRYLMAVLIGKLLMNFQFKKENGLLSLHPYPVEDSTFKNKENQMGEGGAATYRQIWGDSIKKAT